ncbi:SsrA-binding protein [Lacunimicrobium album]
MSGKPAKAVASAKEKDPPIELICQNRRARHEYEILHEIECGIMLHGTEVKSIREGQVSIEEAFASMRDNELWLLGCHIGELKQASVYKHAPRRVRKLLLHRRELKKFADSAKERGQTLVPLTMYFKRGLVKVQLAIARGRKLHDKREKMKKETMSKEIRQAMMPKKQLR